MENKSGASARDVKRPPLLDLLGWLEPYIAERVTSTNWNKSRELINQEEEQYRSNLEAAVNDDDNEELDDIDNQSIVSSVSDTNASILGESSSKQISNVSSRQKFQKGSNKRTAELETDLMYKLRDRLSSNNEKDDDQLYGDLLATKLRKLSKINKLKAKHQIDNIMFQFQLEDEENAIPTYQSQLQSPPATPLATIETSSPVYQPKTQPQSLPGINSFQNLPQTYLNMLESQDLMMNADLFRRMKRDMESGKK